MKIFIPSYHRADSLPARFSADQMPDGLLKDVTLVVREEERAAYEAAVAGKVAVHAFEPPPRLFLHGFPGMEGFFGAAATYDYIIELAISLGLERVILMDDDLIFSGTAEEDFTWEALLEKMSGTCMENPVLTVDAGLDVEPLPDMGEWSENAHFARFYSLYLPFFDENPRYRFTARGEDGLYPPYQPDYWLLCRMYNDGHKSLRYNGIVQEHIEGAGGGENATGRTPELVHQSYALFSRSFPYSWSGSRYVRDYTENWWKAADFSPRAVADMAKGGASPRESHWLDPGADAFWARFWRQADIDGAGWDEIAARMLAVIDPGRARESERAAGGRPCRKIRSFRTADFRALAGMIEKISPGLTRSKSINGRHYCWDNENLALSEVEITVSPVDMSCCPPEVLREFIYGATGETL